MLTKADQITGGSMGWLVGDCLGETIDRELLVNVIGYSQILVRSRLNPDSTSSQPIESRDWMTSTAAPIR
jgi:hypothetical protein